MSESLEKNEANEPLKIDAPDFVKPADGVVTVFIGGDKNAPPKVSTTDEILDMIMRTPDHTGMGHEETMEKILQNKSFEHSNQSKEELIGTDFPKRDSFDTRVQLPPYDPDCFQKFYEINEMHSICVETKVRDTTSREYTITPQHPIGSESEDTLDVTGVTITEEQFQKDSVKITEFIEHCNESESFEEVCFKVATDREVVGWGAFEVIRQANGLIARLQHFPAARLRVLEGFSGFVEILPAVDPHKQEGIRYRYYQPFGQKVGVDVPDVFDLSENPATVFQPYDPDEHGDLELGERGIRFNLVSKEDGEPLTGPVATEFKNAANEVLFLPRTHSSTVYYGYSSIVPAIGALIANVHIRDYLLQFFEHNCIPRYAVVIKGASVDDEFLELITDYFDNKVKGAAHKTIILALTGFGNRNITVDFEKLDVDRKEADFLETRRSNDSIIKAAHGMHDSVIGIAQTSSLGSGSGLSQAEQYKDRILIPLQRYWAQKLNKLFKIGLGCVNAEIKFDPKDIRDHEAVARALVQLVQAGILSINEARDTLGYETTIGGSVPFSRVREGSIVKVEDLIEMASSIDTNPVVTDESAVNNDEEKEESDEEEEESDEEEE